jgi:hypothetical protein
VFRVPLGGCDVTTFASSGNGDVPVARLTSPTTEASLAGRGAQRINRSILFPARAKKLPLGRFPAAHPH